METKVHLQTHVAELETLIDRFGLASVLMQIASVCADKADHIGASYADDVLVRAWARASAAIRRTAETSAVTSVTP